MMIIAHDTVVAIPTVRSAWRPDDGACILGWAPKKRKKRLPDGPNENLSTYLPDIQISSIMPRVVFPRFSVHRPSVCKDDSLPSATWLISRRPRLGRHGKIMLPTSTAKTAPF